MQILLRGLPAHPRSLCRIREVTKESHLFRKQSPLKKEIPKNVEACCPLSCRGVYTADGLVVCLREKAILPRQTSRLNISELLQGPRSRALLEMILTAKTSRVCLFAHSRTYGRKKKKSPGRERSCRTSRSKAGARGHQWEHQCCLHCISPAPT